MAVPSMAWLSRLFANAYPVFVIGPSPRGFINGSGPPEERKPLGQSGASGEPDPDGFCLDNDRDLHLPPGIGEHLLQSFRVFIHVHIDSPVTIDRPGLLYIGSGIGAVNDDLVRHDMVPPSSSGTLRFPRTPWYGVWGYRIGPSAACGMRKFPWSLWARPMNSVHRCGISGCTGLWALHIPLTGAYAGGTGTLRLGFP